MSISYPTKTAILTFGKLDIELSYITNLDELFDELIAKGEDHEDYQDQRIPYWADLWHSAMGLSHYLVKSDLVRPGLSVTEIGCGLGLPGIVAAKLGAKVLMTDYVSEPLEFLEENWKKNNDSPLQTAILDWREPQLQYSAPLILASDVAYEARSFTALLHTIDVMLPAAGHFLLAEPGRAMAKPFLAELMKVTDYQIELHKEEVEWDGFTKQIQIYDIYRKS